MASIVIVLLLIASLGSCAIPELKLTAEHQKLRSDLLQTSDYSEILTPLHDKTVLFNVKKQHTVVLQSPERHLYKPKHVTELLSTVKNAPMPEKRFTTQVARDTEKKVIDASFKQQSDAYPFTPDKFYNFIPAYVGSLDAAGHIMSWSAPCFQESSASAVISGDGKVQLKFQLAKPKSLFCADHYLIATADGWHLHEFFMHGAHTIEWHGLTTDEALDITANGFRVFLFEKSYIQTIADVWYTLHMFLQPLTHPSVSQEAAQRNLQFLHEYSNITMEPRSIQDVDIDESQIKSGWFLGIIRLDGLDPMLAWGMGSHTGHTAITLWINGTLFVCESTTNSAYWPTNGVQKTPFKQWIQQARRASYNVVLLPLTPEQQANFNEVAAANWFNTVQGLSYGFRNMLFGWIDTAEDNYPPPLTAHLTAVGFALVDKLFPKIADMMWNEPINMRLNTTGLSTIQAYNEAWKRGMAITDVLVIPEQDSWVYSNGPNMVCDVLVFEMYKAAGMLGNLTDLIQGTEFTNADVYTLNIFDSNYVRPQQCVQADPDIPYCQLMGTNRMNLVGYNTVKPFPHMRERCPGQPPSYDRPALC